MCEEIWRELKDYDKYEVSNFGNIRHKINKNILKLSIDKGGYCNIRLRIGPVKKSFLIHRLIMLTFKPDEHFNKATVNHIDGNKLNNRLDNLEWCTQTYNSQHAFRTGLKISLKGNDHGSSILKEHQIQVIRNLYKVSIDQTTIGRLFKVDNTTISKIITGKHWSHVKQCHVL